MKLTITISLICFVLNNISGQIKPNDTTAFRNEIEHLLKKYGVSSKLYQINVTSTNQSGGQTAFIITNNYYRDTLSDQTNIGFKIIEGIDFDNLYVYPIKGVWLSPFVAIDSTLITHEYYKPTTGFVLPINGNTTVFGNKPRKLIGFYCSAPSSKNVPTIIQIKKNEPRQFYFFGDLQNPQKSYYYYQRNVIWNPGTDPQ